MTEREEERMAQYSMRRFLLISTHCAETEQWMDPLIEVLRRMKKFIALFQIFDFR